MLFFVMWHMTDQYVQCQGYDDSYLIHVGLDQLSKKRWNEE